MQNGNLFESIPASMPEEIVDVLVSAPDVRIERIVSRGHQSAPDFWYDQNQHEWVLVIQGQASVRFEQEPDLVQLRAGDYLNIPAHARHRVEATSSEHDTIWLAVFYG